MANGTIAFDTLTTSDQANTGTEKSIDTSFIFNGVVKVWCSFDGDVAEASAVLDSFNTATYSDNGTGQYTITYTNVMSSANYGNLTGAGDNRTMGTGNTSPSTSSSGDIFTRAANSATLTDGQNMTQSVVGDLA